MEKLLELGKKILSHSWFVVCVALGIALAKLFLPAKVIYQGKPFPVRDSLAIAAAVAETKKIADDTVQTLWDKILGLQKRTPPTGYFGTPSSDPFPPTKLEIYSKDSSVFTVTYEPAFDAPISLVANRNSIVITTRNQYNYQRGDPYIKVYEWPRLARDFSLALLPTIHFDRLDGINLYFDKRAFEFDGFGLIAGAGYPERFYAGVDARFILWEKLELTPRLLTTPQLIIEARWRF